MTMKKKKENKKTTIILIAVCFSLLSLVSVLVVSHLFANPIKEVYSKEQALIHSKLFVEQALTIKQPQNMQDDEIFYNKEDIVQSARINSCKRITPVLSDRFVGIRDCYAIPPLEQASNLGNVALFTQVQDIHQVGYSLLRQDNEQRIEYDVTLKIQAIMPLATDASSDGSFVRKKATIPFKGIYVITDAKGNVIKSNLTEQTKTFSVFWDGTSDVFNEEVYWEE